MYHGLMRSLKKVHLTFNKKYDIILKKGIYIPYISNYSFGQENNIINPARGAMPLSGIFYLAPPNITKKVKIFHKILKFSIK